MWRRQSSKGRRGSSGFSSPPHQSVLQRLSLASATTWPRDAPHKATSPRTPVPAIWRFKRIQFISPNYLMTVIQTSCSASCNEGFRLLLPNREAHSCEPSTLQVLKPQEPKKIGIKILFLDEPPQVLPCNDRPCPVDCRWDHWSPWSPCTGKSVLILHLAKKMCTGKSVHISYIWPN